MTMKNYQVTRPDGHVQYATSHDNGKTFALFGSGFLIGSFSEGTKILEIAQVPKNYKEGKVCIDGEMICRAIWDKNQRWNGWLMPKILAEDALKLVSELPEEKEYTELKIEGQNILVIDHQYGEDNETICPEVINGKTYYNLGYLGWIWEEYKEQTED